MRKLVSILLCAAVLCAVTVVPATDNSAVSTYGVIDLDDFEENPEN